MLVTKADLYALSNFLTNAAALRSSNFCDLIFYIMLFILVTFNEINDIVIACSLDAVTVIYKSVTDQFFLSLSPWKTVSKLLEKSLLFSYACIMLSLLAAFILTNWIQWMNLFLFI